MQRIKEYIFQKCKDHPFLSTLSFLTFWLVKDFTIEVYHKGIAAHATATLNTIQENLVHLLSWLQSPHSFSGYLLILYWSITACVIGALYFLFRRSQQQLIVLRAEKHQNEKVTEAEHSQYNADTIKGIRWRWDNGGGKHDIYNLAPFCPDATCDGELKPTPFTKHFPAKVVHICAHCGKPAHSFKYNLNLQHFTKATDEFYDIIKTEIRRRKRLKNIESQSDVAP